MVTQHIVEKPLSGVYHASILRGRAYSAPNFQDPTYSNKITKFGVVTQMGDVF